jgi:hypothetical protein
MVAQRPDLMVLNASGLPYLAVEVDNQQNPSTEKAVKFRSQVVPYLTGASTPCLMLVSQERGFLWTRNDSAPPEASPDTEFPVAPIISQYEASPQPVALRRFRGTELEILIWRWLVDITWGEQASPQAPVPPGLESLLSHLRGGKVVMEPRE